MNVTFLHDLLLPDLNTHIFFGIRIRRVCFKTKDQDPNLEKKFGSIPVIFSSQFSCITFYPQIVNCTLPKN